MHIDIAHTHTHTYVHRGEFVDNEIHGKGTLQGFLKDDLTSAFVYMGDMQHGKMHGGIRLYMCVYVCEGMGVCVCMYVCIYIYIYIYIYIDIYTPS
jgi:hypothetical protein